MHCLTASFVRLLFQFYSLFLAASFSHLLSFTLFWRNLIIWAAFIHIRYKYYSSILIVGSYYSKDSIVFTLLLCKILQHERSRYFCCFSYVMCTMALFRMCYIRNLFVEAFFKFSLSQSIQCPRHVVDCTGCIYAISFTCIYTIKSSRIHIISAKTMQWSPWEHSKTWTKTIWKNMKHSF